MRLGCFEDGCCCCFYRVFQRVRSGVVFVVFVVRNSVP